MSKKVEFIKPQKFYEVFDEIGELLHDKIMDMKDRELFYDRGKWINKNTDWDTYKSNQEFDKDFIYDGDLNTISIYIFQLVLFGRIIKERYDGEYNLPDGQVPLFNRQIDEKGNEEDLYNISSGKIMKNWSKKKKSKKRLKEFISSVS